VGFLLGTVGWEAGAKAGFDTNVSRSIDDGEGSGNVSAYGSYWKGHAAETRLDWTMGFVLHGAVYPSLPDVDYAAAMFSPGLEGAVPGEGWGGSPPPSGPRCSRKPWMPTPSRFRPGSTGRGPGFRPRTTRTGLGMANGARRRAVPGLRASGTVSESGSIKEVRMRSPTFGLEYPWAINIL